MQMDNDLKHPVKAMQELLKAMKLMILQGPIQSPDLSPAEPEDKTEGRKSHKKQQLRVATVKAWQSISKKEDQHLVRSIGSRLQTANVCIGFSSKY